MTEKIQHDITLHNKQVEFEMLKPLLEISPARFEGVIFKFLFGEFYNLAPIKKRDDGSVDFRANLVVGNSITIPMLIHVRRWEPNKLVQASDIKQLREALSINQQGMIITTSDFSEDAKEEAESIDHHAIHLMNGEQFAEGLADKGIGILRKTFDVIELNVQ